jgi:hypothetical protein
VVLDHFENLAKAEYCHLRRKQRFTLRKGVVYKTWDLGTAGSLS